MLSVFAAVAASLLLFQTSIIPVQAIGHAACVSFSKTSNFTYPLVAGGATATILVSPDEWPGVQQLALESFASDIQKVTGKTITIKNATSLSGLSSKGGPVFIVGTLGHSTLIDSIANSTTSLRSASLNLTGQWEAYSAQPVSLLGVPGGQAYVVMGSDKRGTIYGLYELSEQVRNESELSGWSAHPHAVLTEYWSFFCPSIGRSFAMVLVGGCPNQDPCKSLSIALRQRAPNCEVSGHL